MALLPIKLVGDPVLRAKARPVDRFDAALSRLLDDMLETMYAAPGIGLAAPQVGVSKRVLVIDLGEDPIRMVNPKIVAQEGEEIGLEGCLSIPEIFGDVKRFAKITVKGQDELGRPYRIEADGLLARCFQHEIDHLDGKLFTDTAESVHQRKPQADDEDEDEEGDSEEEQAEVGAEVQA